MSIAPRKKMSHFKAAIVHVILLPTKLFPRCGGTLQSATRVLTRHPGKVPELMKSRAESGGSPLLLLSAYLHARWQSEDDPVPLWGCASFLQAIVPLLWILSVGLIWKYMYLHLLMRVFLLCLPMEPRLAPHGRPTLMGPIGNLVIWYNHPLSRFKAELLVHHHQAVTIHSE
jgi:hypothetical protein